MEWLLSNWQLVVAVVGGLFILRGVATGSGLSFSSLFGKADDATPDAAKIQEAMLLLRDHLDAATFEAMCEQVARSIWIKGPDLPPNLAALDMTPPALVDANADLLARTAKAFEELLARIEARAAQAAAPTQGT